jgi:hypothetical protein
MMCTTAGVAEEEFLRVTQWTFHSPDNTLMVWVVRPRGFERLTFGSSGKRSIYRLSRALNQFRVPTRKVKRGPKFGARKRITVTECDLVTI